MVEYKTISMEEIKYGENKFIEVSRKVVVSEDGEREVISISKGYIDPSNNRKYQKGLGFPFDMNIIEGLSNALKRVSGEK